MAEGDADPEQGATTEGTGDAGPNTTGATAEGESDAGSDQTGATGGTDGNPYQEGYNRGAREVREELQGKLKTYESKVNELESRLEELKGNPGEAKAAEDEDLFTKEQVEELKESYQSELEEREQAVRQASRATARNRLVEELRQRNVVKPDMFADALIDRVEADVTEGLDHIEVYTEQGNRMLNDDGDPATVEYLVERWVEQNPEFVAADSKAGAGFAGADGGTTSGWPDTKSAFSDEQQIRFIQEEGHEAWEALPYD